MIFQKFKLKEGVVKILAGSDKDTETGNVFGDLELDISNCSDRSTECLDILDKIDRVVIFDFSLITYMDARGAQYILWLNDRILDLYKQVFVINVKPEIKRIFDILGIKQLAICNSIDDVLNKNCL